MNLEVAGVCIQEGPHRCAPHISMWRRPRGHQPQRAAGIRLANGIEGLVTNG